MEATGDESPSVPNVYKPSGLVAAFGVCAVCDGFGFVRNTGTTFDVFYWYQVTNFDGLPDSGPNGPDYIDIWGLCFHAQLIS
jgi:hypothetical protein